MIYTPPPRHPVNPVVVTPWGDFSVGTSIATTGAPASGTWGASVVSIIPLYLPEPFTVLKAFWANGATVGTDSVDIGVYRMTDLATGRLDLIRSTGAILSAGTSVAQGSATWRVACTNLTSGNDSTDRSSAPGYTTASVTLKAGRLYLLSVVNTAAAAAVVSAITGGGTWTSRSSTQFNTTAHRVSIWSCVPSVDYTGTLDIAFGATQTGSTWSLNEFSGVDTATTDGVVQQAVGTGNDTTPLATLAAFGSANNATFGALGNVSDTTTTPGAGFTELSDSNAATPASCLETEWRVDNDTTVDGTITSGQWGASAVELKADASAFVIPPATPGNPNVYMALACSGGTATFLRAALDTRTARGSGMFQGAAFPLPSTLTPAAATTNGRIPMAGFSLRTLLD